MPLCKYGTFYCFTPYIMVMIAVIYYRYYYCYNGIVIIYNSLQ